MRDGSTALGGVRRLCPGEVLVVDREGVRVARVDRLVPREVTGNPRQLRRLFVEEVGAALATVSKRAPSLFSLSGGLDSAALVGTALERAESVAALSVVAPTLDPLAEIPALDVLERAWPPLRLTRLDASAADELEIPGELRDDPPLTPMALLPARLLLWWRARADGFQVIIEGEGGDELFAVLPTPVDALHRGHLLEAALHSLRSADRRALLEYGLWIPILPGPLRHAWLRHRQPTGTQLPAFALPDAGRDPNVRQAIDECRTTLLHLPFAERLNEWLSAPMVVGAALSRRHLAAGLGLELEWPMLERELLELVLGLHDAHALHAGREKHFLRSALAGIVPDDVRLAPKDVGLYRALIPKILTSRRAREAMRDDRVRKRIAHLVRFDAIDTLLDALASGQALSFAELWPLECIAAFAEWYSRAAREYGVD
jgi:asparagine synthase (glutamine-hydrolysing)